MRRIAMAGLRVCGRRALRVWRGPLQVWIIGTAIVGGCMTLQHFTPPKPPTPELVYPVRSGPSEGEVLLGKAFNVAEWALTPCTEEVFPAYAHTQWKGRLLKARTCPTISGGRRAELFVETAGGWQLIPLDR